MDKDRTSDRDDVEEYDEGWTGEVSRAGEDDRNDLASARTAMAEDRTILANERTYAGWMRTGMASVGIGLAFNALFVRMEPWWVPRSIATAFFLVAIFILVSAERRACAVTKRMHAHRVQTVGNNRLRIISLISSLAVAALVVAMWFLPIAR